MGNGLAAQRIGVNISAGTGLAQSGTVLLSNANGMSFGMQFSASSYVITGSFNAITAISAGTALALGPTVVISGGSGVTVGVSGSTVTVGLSNVSYFDAPGERNVAIPFLQNATANSGIFSLQRFTVHHPINVTEIDLLRHLTVAGSTQNSYSLQLGLYTLGTDGNLSSASSTSIGVTFNSGTNTNVVSIYGGHSGTRFQSISLAGVTWALSPGEYWFALGGALGGVAGTTASLTFFGRSSISIAGDIGGGNISRFFADAVATRVNTAFPNQIATNGGAFTATGSLPIGQPYFRLLGI